MIETILKNILLFYDKKSTISFFNFAINNLSFILNPKLFKKMSINSIIRSKNLHSKPFSKELYEHILFVSEQ